MNIKNRFTGEIIYRSKKRVLRTVIEEAIKNNADLHSADLRYADLSSADLSYADLRSADLSYADLRSADLRSADLSYADLSSANLRSANLNSVDLRYADLSSANLLPDLYILKFQLSKTVLRAWKYLQAGKSPYQGSEYKVGKIYTEKDFSTDERIACDKGLNVATLQWCLDDSSCRDNEYIEVEFYVGDIVAIPFATDGKFRVKRFKVLRKIDRKKARGLIDKHLEPYCKEKASA